MREKIPQLDAVRGLAILLVMFHNTVSAYPELHLQKVFASGWMGVDLFFVLSGFLITGILLDTKDSAGYFKNFYARRILRIWPLYYSVMILVLVAIPLALPWTAGAISSARSSPHWSYLLFVQNFLVPVPSSATGPLGVTWSLAVEEQFYLFWPLLVRYCSLSQLRRISIGIVCVSPVLRLYLAAHQVNIYSNPFCRLDGLMAGALIAFFARSQHFRSATLIKLAWTSLLIAAPLVVIFDAFDVRWLVHSLAVAAAAALVCLSLFCSFSWFQAVMTNRFLVYTGSISYGLYLLHKIPFDALKAGLPTGPPLPMFGIGLVGSYGLAMLSWNLLEKPFLLLKRLFPSKYAFSGTVQGTIECYVDSHAAQACPLGPSHVKSL